jgi:two-component system cell cycle sensor histidine kinase/response regulator CckA
MTSSSATPSVRPSREVLSLVSGRTPDWRRIGESVRGPLLTLAAAVVLDVLRRHDMGILTPFPILLLTVVYSAYAGGLRPALVSVVITILDALHFFAEPGRPLHYTPGNAGSLVAVACSALLTGVVVARLQERLAHARAIEVSRAEAEELSRRFAFLEQASLILSSTRDVDAMFRDLARLLVPTLADWCTIHLAADDGTWYLAAVAHRDPSRDIVVRAFAESGDRGLPFATEALAPRVARVNDSRFPGSDPELEKLGRALAPSVVLRLPLRARDREVGFFTLVLTRDAGRDFPLADIDLAEELALASAVAVDGVRLRHDLGEAERQLRLIFDAHPQPMWLFDVDTLAFLDVNAAAVQLYGWSREELRGMTILDLLAPEDAAPTPAVPDRAGARGEAALAHHRRRDGTLVDIEIVSHELELDGRRARLVLATDRTERARTLAALHQSEEQLRHVQRSEALGRIAGAVAHDFNNLLTTIRGYGEMMLLDLVPDDRRRLDVQRICQAADRGTVLTRQLLSLGRAGTKAPALVNLNDVVLGLESLAQRLVGADVRLDVRLASTLGYVRADPAQLEHLVLNLVLAAGDAMPAGGRLAIETAERRISGLSRGRPVRPGRYVLLAVTDSGSGLGEADNDDPAGGDRRQGGLGRALILGIVRQYGGVVRVSSEPGEGTTVKVYLPRVDSDEAAPVTPEDGATAALRGRETVLVAEDEEGVRELLRKILQEFGYTVLAARHGRDALLLAGEHGGGIDLLLTDVVMPEMSGRELAETLQDRQPGLKVLFMSGYTDDEVLQRGVSGKDASLLRKPFAAEELVRRVRMLLDGVPA